MRLLVAKAAQVSHNIPHDLPASRTDYRDVNNPDRLGIAMSSQIVEVFRALLEYSSSRRTITMPWWPQVVETTTAVAAYLEFSRPEYLGTRRFWVSMKFEYRRKALGFVDSRRDT